MTQPTQPIATPKPSIEPLLVRVEEAARMLSLSRSTIYEMMDAGELPSVRRGSARRIPVAALREWVNQQTEPSKTHS
jgi:excisionase family DNA binding protein